MYLLTFDAVPTQLHEEFKEVRGAFVNAWIPSDHAEGLDEAEAMAREHIIGSHWCIKKLDRSSMIDEDDFEPHDDDSEYFECALSGEQAYVFNTYPHDEEE